MIERTPPRVSFMRKLSQEASQTPSVAATGQVISGGRRVVTASGQITGPEGTLYAHATTTCLVFEPRSAQEKEPSGRSRENGHGR